MSKFKVGDKVRRIGKTTGKMKNGVIYTVSEVGNFSQNHLLNGEISVKEVLGEWDENNFELISAEDELL